MADDIGEHAAHVAGPNPDNVGTSLPIGFALCLRSCSTTNAMVRSFGIFYTWLRSMMERYGARGCRSSLTAADVVLNVSRCAF